jgi:hypothetical protein
MKKENNQKLISEKVISEIGKRGIKMKPKLYFIIKSLLFIGSIFLLSLFVLYLGSLIVFVLKVNNIFYFHGMGFHAIRSVILSFPWYLVFLAVALIISIEIISKRFSFIYRKPLIYSLITIIILTSIGSFLIEKSSVHQYFFNLAKHEKLPVAGKMYRNLGNIDIENTYFGKALKKEGGNWIIELDSGEKVFLIINEQSIGRRIYLEIKEGSEVMVIGEMKNGLIDVFAFRRIDGRFRINER